MNGWSDPICPAPTRPPPGFREAVAKDRVNAVKEAEDKFNAAVLAVPDDASLSQAAKCWSPAPAVEPLRAPRPASRRALHLIHKCIEDGELPFDEFEAGLRLMEPPGVVDLGVVLDPA